MRTLSRITGRILIAGLAACAGLIARDPLDPRPIEAAAQATIHAGKPNTPLAKAPARRTAPTRQVAPAQVTPAAKVEAPARVPFDRDDEAAAVVPGIPDARAWGDSEDDFAKLLPTERGPWLAISGGGSDGAYAAGLLTGMSQAGDRPQFAVVTGASIGALLAPFAFLGPSYDDELHALFTTITAGDIFEDSATPDSLMDSWPLKRTIEKHATAKLLAAVAAEHKRGRRLLVVTTDLDSGRRVIWNMGAIAAQGDDKALALFRSVLLASASIPGIFPPVLIDVEANGKKFQELHNDGTITAPFFIAPESVLAGSGTVHLPTDHVYVIANAKLTPQFDMTTPQTTAVLGRSITVALQAALRVELLLTLAAAQKRGISVSVAQIDPEFQHASHGAFDPDYMQALYAFAVERAKKGDAFETVAPEQHGNAAR